PVAQPLVLRFCDGTHEARRRARPLAHAEDGHVMASGAQRVDERGTDQLYTPVAAWWQLVPGGNHHGDLEWVSKVAMVGLCRCHVRPLPVVSARVGARRWSTAPGRDQAPSAEGATTPSGPDRTSETNQVTYGRPGEDSPGEHP